MLCSFNKLNMNYVRKLTKVGGGRTYSVTLPISSIRKFKWKSKQKLIIEVDEKRKRFIVKDWS